MNLVTASIEETAPLLLLKQKKTKSMTEMSPLLNEMQLELLLALHAFVHVQTWNPRRKRLLQHIQALFAFRVLHLRVDALVVQVPLLEDADVVL
jgi:hypothetical protein